MINYDKVFSKFPDLETKSLKLEAFSEYDAVAYYNMCQDPDYSKEFIPAGMQVSPTDALKTVTIMHPTSFKERKDITWAVILKGEIERIIGLRDLFIDSPTEPAVTQGFISKEYRNKGYNQEVLNAVIKFLKEVGAESLVFNCGVDNKPVIHIAEKLRFEDISSLPMKMMRGRCKFQLPL